MVEDIVCYVGRTGVLTPVAHLRPVIVGGVTVRNASLHNEDLVNQKGVYVGAAVVVQRAGDVIPEVVSVKEPRPGWKMPAQCPICGGQVVREEPYVAHRCINPFCPAQRLQNLLLYASRGGLNIDGLGYSTLNQLINRGLVEDPSDFYRLTVEQVESLDRFARKSAENLIQSIDGSRTPPLARLLSALGIPQVGEATAELLAAEFGSLERLHDASEEQLQTVDGVGPSMAREIRAYFQGRGSELVRRLLDAGVRPEAPEAPAADGPFAGKTVVFTGTLERISRPEAEALVRSLGGKAAGSVSARTDFVVAGPGAGSKLERAQKLKVSVLSEVEWMLRSAMLIQVCGRADQIARHFTKPSHNERGVGQDGDADCRVEPFTDEIGESIAQVEIDRYLRKGGKEFRQQRRHMQQPERHGCCQPHQPTRHRCLRPCGVFGCFALSEDVRSPACELASGVSERQIGPAGVGAGAAPFGFAVPDQPKLAGHC